jgi:histidine triad (HIT) family protein
MKSCIYCGFVSNRLSHYRIYEDDNFIAFLDKNPIQKGHILLITKKHIGSIFDLNNNLYQKAFNTTKKIAKLLHMKLRTKRIGIAIEGFTYNHVHIHIVPVNKANDLDPNLAKQAKNDELELLQQTIIS